METPYEELLERLARAEVSFIIIGGVAVALNGFVRTTEDLDILVEHSPQNIARLLDALSGFGEGHARELTIADFDEAEGAIRIIEEFPLDIFTIVRGKRYGDLLPEMRQTLIGDISVQYLNAEALIALKENSQRERDQIDVVALRSRHPRPGAEGIAGVDQAG
jgi:predicted nucleotidyltransferase